MSSHEWVVLLVDHVTLPFLDSSTRALLVRRAVHPAIHMCQVLDQSIVIIVQAEGIHREGRELLAVCDQILKLPVLILIRH